MIKHYLDEYNEKNIFSPIILTPEENIGLVFSSLAKLGRYDFKTISNLFLFETYKFKDKYIDPWRMVDIFLKFKGLLKKDSKNNYLVETYNEITQLKFFMTLPNNIILSNNIEAINKTHTEIKELSKRLHFLSNFCKIYSKSNERIVSLILLDYCKGALIYLHND